MTIITKVMCIKGAYFTREHIKIGKHKNKIRPLREDTVAKEFKKGCVQVNVFFEEDGRLIEILPESGEELILRYLGKKFI